MQSITVSYVFEYFMVCVCVCVSDLSELQKSGEEQRPMSLKSWPENLEGKFETDLKQIQETLVILA